MKNFIDTIRRQVTEFFGKLAKKQKIIIAVSAVALLAVVITLSLLLGRVKYEVLYTGLDESEAGKIMSVLEDKNIDAKAQGTGTILVPSADADKVRMELAAQGYPETGLNYDIFSGTSSLGKTDQEIETYEKYQLQENLRETILMLDKIKDCVVLVNMPQNSLYVLSSDDSKASASVMLDIKNGQTLTSGEAKAIAELVSKSVPNLSIEDVRIVDSAMNLYDVTGDNQEEYTGTQYQLTEQMKETLGKQVMSILTPVFGTDNVSAAVNVVLNFDKETVNSVAFNPPVDGEDKGLARSVEELYEKTQGDTSASGTPGTDSTGWTPNPVKRRPRRQLLKIAGRQHELTDADGIAKRRLNPAPFRGGAYQQRRLQRGLYRQRYPARIQGDRCRRVPRVRGEHAVYDGSGDKRA